MEKITWDVFSALVLQYGLPLALKLATKWGRKDAVSDEELAELRQLGAQTPKTQMLDALSRAGIDPADPKAAALLALVGS